MNAPRLRCGPKAAEAEKTDVTRTETCDGGGPSRARINPVAAMEGLTSPAGATKGLWIVQRYAHRIISTVPTWRLKRFTAKGRSTTAKTQLPSAPGLDKRTHWLVDCPKPMPGCFKNWQAKIPHNEARKQIPQPHRGNNREAYGSFEGSNSKRQRHARILKLRSTPRSSTRPLTRSASPTSAKLKPNPSRACPSNSCFATTSTMPS